MSFRISVTLLIVLSSLKCFPALAEEPTKVLIETAPSSSTLAQSAVPPSSETIQIKSPPQASSPSNIEATDLERKSSALQVIAATKLTDNRISPEDQESLDKAYLLVKDICTKTLTSLSGDAKERARYSIWVAITGAVAGSVIAPSILAGGGGKVAASMFSGLSGAANTAQQVVSDQGITAESSRASREKVLGAVRTALNDYSAALSDTSASAENRLAKMKAALFKADMECFLRPE